MPVFWILVVGVLLYMGLQMLEKQYSSNNKKRNLEKETAPAAKAVETPAIPEPKAEESVKKRPFLDTISGMPGETKGALRELGLTSPGAISATPDKDLLAINGIGPARLKQIRGICADATNPESEFA
jgi:predicted flap endonuclease-1-like 5' DNA nuclease